MQISTLNGPLYLDNSSHQLGWDPTSQVSFSEQRLAEGHGNKHSSKLF